MKKIFLVVAFLMSASCSVAKTVDCNEYDKLSAEYAKCTSEFIKKKSLEINTF